MLVVLILVPAVVLAVAVVAVLDRLGVLPRLDTGRPSAATYGTWFERVPRGALYAAAGLMAAWIVAWLVFFVVGLSVLRS
ncbi:MAG TPA: hypothetical protein VHT97_11150 [Acidimicrobiales bacterium]|jgi:hypothetical protein|nr:hypothetical protein [Acidimicrobiales bacterium]